MADVVWQGSASWSVDPDSSVAQVWLHCPPVNRLVLEPAARGQGLNIKVIPDSPGSAPIVLPELPWDAVAALLAVASRLLADRMKADAERIDRLMNELAAWQQAG